MIQLWLRTAFAHPPDTVIVWYILWLLIIENDDWDWLWSKLTKVSEYFENIKVITTSFDLFRPSHGKCIQKTAQNSFESRDMITGSASASTHFK